MHNRFKPILPAPIGPRPPEGATSPTASPIPGSSTTLRQRRAPVRIACNGCRAKRTACDGNRPSCNQCLKRGSPCVYVSVSSAETPVMAMKREMEGLKKNHDSLAETIDILRSAPEDTSVSILKRLRSMSVTDPAGLLSLAKGDNPPDDTFPRQVMARPPPQDGQEFELMLRHAWAYPALLPLDAAAVSTTTFTVASSRPSPDSLPDPTPNPSLQPQPSQVSQPSQSGSSQASPGYQSPASIPPESSLPTNTLPADFFEYVDERLDLLQIGYWIGTDIPNPVAAGLISLYLKTDHPTLGLFDSGLFLDDLVARRTRFCSPLLVCSILVCAYHAYTSFVPDPDSIVEVMLLSEALALWKYEQNMDSLPTLAATQLLSLNCIYNGEDAGLPYLAVGSEMSQRLGLLGEHRTRFPLPVGHESCIDEDDWTQAVSHTAWGVYNCLAMHSFMFQRYELALDFPPLLDVPGGYSHTQGDESLTDGDVAPSLADYMGRTFPATCHFWVLTSQWMSHYYMALQTPVLGRVSWSFAEKMFEKLLSWTDGLHFRLARGDQARHHDTILHIWFHASILEIFRPFATPSSGHVHDSAVSSEEEDAAKAQALFTASLNQLKHLIIVFRYTYPCARYSVFWHMALLDVANAALEDTSDAQWRAYFGLCVNCYADLFGAFPVAEGIVRSLLSMGLRDSTISAPEAQSFLHRVRSRGLHPSYLNPTTSTMVVDLKLATTDRNAAQLKAMADMFDSLTLFDQFIHNPEEAAVARLQVVEGSPVVD